LAILGACLIEAGIDEKDISILDLPIEIQSRKNIPEELASIDDSIELLIEKVKMFNPDVVGIGIHAAPFIPDVSDCVNAIRKTKSDVIITTGGIIPSIFKQKIFEIIPEIDVAFEGDAEKSFVQFIQSIDSSKKNYSKHTIVPSLSGSSKKLKYPLPAYHLLSLDLYRKYYATAGEFEEQFAPHLEVMRGCPYQCNFCGVERNVRIREIEDVIKEIDFLSNLGYKKLYFCDETFTLYADITEKLCKAIIDHNYDISWRCVTRSDSINKHPELVKLMKEAGCYEIGLGIEVGSQEMLDKIKKGLKIDNQIEATRLLQKNGIGVNALVILCNPQEKHSDIRRTFEFVANQLKPTTSQVFIFHPVPSTPYFDSGSTFGIDTHVNTIQDWYKWDHTGEPVSGTPNFSREDMLKYYFAYNHAFHTVIDSEPDHEYLERILNPQNIFPRRKLDVVFQWNGKEAFFYNPSYPEGIYDGNIYLNSRKLSALTNDLFPDYKGEKPLEEISDKLFYEVLLHCNGDLSIREIAEIITLLIPVISDEASKIVNEVLRRFEMLNLIYRLDD